MMKKFIYIITSILIFVSSIFIFTGCNKNIIDLNLKLEYILIREGNGIPVLHKIKSWSDSDSDSATVTTDCCDNYIWTSSNNATLYKDFPTYLKEGVDYVKCPSMEG